MSVDKHQELRNRTKAFALRVIHMSEALPQKRAANVIDNEILRSATSMAANYRAAGRSRSKAEFVAKLGVVIEEADETVFWLELLSDSGLIKPSKLESMLDETNQLLAIFAASRRTARA
jgi:four helix bundle protein